MMELYEAQTLAEFVQLLMQEQGYSYAALATKIGIGTSTLHGIVQGTSKPEDSTLDKIADYAGVTRDWLYALAKGTSVRPKYSRPLSLLIALLERAPIEDQEDVLAMARGFVESRKKKKSANIKQNLDKLAGT